MDTPLTVWINTRETERFVEFRTSLWSSREYFCEQVESTQSCCRIQSQIVPTFPRRHNAAVPQQAHHPAGIPGGDNVQGSPHWPGSDDLALGKCHSDIGSGKTWCSQGDGQ